MSTSDSIFASSGMQTFFEDVNNFARQLPDDVRARFRRIFRDYVVSYEFQEAFDRLNGRSIEEIFAQYQPVNPTIVEAGQIGGTRYTLYERPNVARGQGTGGVSEGSE